ncbi:MAG: tetratricopeptide repeat protein [Desulfobacteraceae bacterium]|jgi:tetratricopeptide (TPR) repeat protein
MTSVESQYQEIKAEMGTENHESTIYRLEALLDDHPDFSPAHDELGFLYYQAGQHDNALNHFEKAAQLEPGNPKFQKNLADFYYTALSRDEDALEIFEKLLVEDPSSGEILLITANLLVSMNRFAEAQAHYESLLNLEPWRLDIQELVDKLKHRNGNSLTDVESLYQSAQAHAQNSEIESAMGKLEEILKQNPDYALAYNDLGVLSYQIGEVEKAREYYEKAVSLEPTNHIFMKNLAEHYLLVMGEIEKALELYVVILKDDPQDVEALMAAGRISEALNNHEQASIFYEAVLDAEPWNMEASERLAAMGQGDDTSESKLSIH